MARTLVAIERRALPLVLLAMALFFVTGTHLLFVDAKYAGLGDFLANGWTTLMLVKHLVVVLLIALGLVVDSSCGASARRLTTRPARRLCDSGG